LRDGLEINNRFGEGVYGPRDGQRKSIPMGSLSTILLAEVMAILKYTKILVSKKVTRTRIHTLHTLIAGQQ
jgi:hypothetical protein